MTVAAVAGVVTTTAIGCTHTRFNAMAGTVTHAMHATLCLIATKMTVATKREIDVAALALALIQPGIFAMVSDVIQIVIRRPDLAGIVMTQVTTPGCCQFYHMAVVANGFQRFIGNDIERLKLLQVSDTVFTK